jgi:hypothetical protein
MGNWLARHAKVSVAVAYGMALGTIIIGCSFGWTQASDLSDPKLLLVRMHTLDRMLVANAIATLVIATILQRMIKPRPQSASAKTTGTVAG